MSFPVNFVDEIVQEFRKVLEKGKQNDRRVRLVVIDYVTSMPSMVIHVKELVWICREEGVDLDAAYGIRCVDVDWG